MNEPESIAIKKELDAYLDSVSLETLKEATFDAIGMRHYSADADFIWMSRRIGEMKTAALLGDIDAIRYLHHIAILATDALSRATNPFRSATSHPPESSDLTDGGDLDFGVIASSAARLENLDGSSLSDLHKRTLAEEREEGLHPDQPFLPLSPALFPESEVLTTSQYSASEIVSSLLRKHLGRKIRPDIRHFVGNCTAWPGKYFVGLLGRVTKSEAFNMPKGLGEKFPHSNRTRSPDSRSAFAYTAFAALQEYKSSPLPHTAHDKKIYSGGMKQLERYLLEIERQKKRPAEKRAKLTKPEPFEHLFELRWKWDAEELPELTPVDYAIGRWAESASKWVESFTKGDVSSVPWPDYITRRRGGLENPTMATIKEILKTEFKKIAQRLSEQASEISADPKLLSKRDQDFNISFHAKTQAGGRAVADALKISENSQALSQSLQTLAIPLIRDSLVKTNLVAKKATRKKGKA